MKLSSTVNPSDSGLQTKWTDVPHATTPGVDVPPGSFMDVSLADLSPEVESSLRAVSGSWLTSFGFCTSYAFPPASHVRVSLDECARVSKACYYVERHWRQSFKKLHIFGPTDLTCLEIQRLLRDRGASIATITCMGPDDVTGWEGPWHRCSSAAVNEDIVVELPRSEEEYLRSLGHNARTQLPYYLRRVQKEWGDGYTLFHATGPDISLDMFTELVELNRIRIERKGAVHLWHSQLVRQRWRLAQECGLFCGLQFDGKLVAGTMSYLHRDEAYFVLIGHRADFDRLRLGKLVLWLTIQRLIKTGFIRYHLLWGKSSYKFQLGGQPVTLSEVTVFRHPWTAVHWHLEKGKQELLRYVQRGARIPAGIARRISAAILRSSSADRGS